MLTVENTWESYEYRVNGVLVKNITKASVNGIFHKVRSEYRKRSYQDMGHPYEGGSEDYYVTKKIFGVMHKFFLVGLLKRGVKIEIIDWT